MGGGMKFIQAVLLKSAILQPLILKKNKRVFTGCNLIALGWGGPCSNVCAKVNKTTTNREVFISLEGNLSRTSGFGKKKSDCCLEIIGKRVCLVCESLQTKTAKEYSTREQYFPYVISISVIFKTTLNCPKLKQNP